jgi:hypothetical protein
MKFVDKYALIPIDRYNHWIKQLNINEEKGTSEKQTGSGGKDIQEEEEKTPFEEQPDIDTKVTTDKNNIDKIEKQTIQDSSSKTLVQGTTDFKVQPVHSNSTKDNKLKKKIKKSKKKKIYKVPPLPPGIPNKLSKTALRWVSLF